MQAEKLKERTLQKKESIKSIEKWRKARKHNDFADDGKAPEGFEDEKRGRGQGSRGGARDRGGGGGQHGGSGGGGPRSTMETQAKREFKNDKFGFGGRKRVSFFLFSRHVDPCLFFFLSLPSLAVTSFLYPSCRPSFIFSRHAVVVFFSFFPSLFFTVVLPRSKIVGGCRGSARSPVIMRTGAPSHLRCISQA